VKILFFGQRSNSGLSSSQAAPPSQKLQLSTQNRLSGMHKVGGSFRGATCNRRFVLPTYVASIATW
jgi:hypothetical protein